MHSPPVVLTIAGSDCSAGAGIQADLKTFSFHGTHGLTALTCVVAETPHKVVSIHPIPPAILQDQIRVLLETYPIAAIKTGMLFSKPHIVAISELLSECAVPLIVDPVMIASSGAALLKEDATNAYCERLLPLATLITPNMPEASVLLDRPITTSEQIEPAAEEIAEKFSTSCLLKGGHLPEDQARLDILWHAGEAHQFTAPTIKIDSAHGTGCSLSAAITALVAHGTPLPEAVATAKQWIHSAIGNSFQWNTPEGATVFALNQLRSGSLH